MRTVRISIERLAQALHDAEATERANRAGSPPEARAYDAGRVAGLRQALEVVQAQ